MGVYMSYPPTVQGVGMKRMICVILSVIVLVGCWSPSDSPDGFEEKQEPETAAVTGINMIQIGGLHDDLRHRLILE